MGGGHHDRDDLKSYVNSTRGLSADSLYSRRSADDTKTVSGQRVNAVEIKVRESRDSADHPESLPVMIGLDGTGSMGFLAAYMASEGLPGFVENLLQRKTLTDSHLMFLVYGDAVACDKQPLQMTQFEADNRICTQLRDLWLEGCGGGNNYESQDLVWAAAAFKTVSDSWEKRQKKGYLFTIGDELFPKVSDKDYLRNLLKKEVTQVPSTPGELLQAAQEKYHVFHLVVKEGNYAKNQSARVLQDWQTHLGKRALILTNHKHVAEVLVSAIAVNEGEDPETVIGWWSGEVADTVRSALHSYDDVKGQAV